MPFETLEIAHSRPSRLTVMRAAVWSVPVVAVAAAAPAFAASCNALYPALIDWGVTSYTRTSATFGRATVTPTGGLPANLGTMTVDFSSNFDGYNPQTDSQDANLKVTDVNIGALGQRGLAFFQTRSTSTNNNTKSQTVTIAFARPVQNLSFTVTDVDSSNGNYRDNVGFSPAPTSFSAVSGLQGSGTLGSPFVPTSTNNSVNENASGGNVSVSFAGPLSSLTMTYWNSSTSGNQQVVYLADFAFNVHNAGC